mgnify:CR=1 FL=1
MTVQSNDVIAIADLLKDDDLSEAVRAALAILQKITDRPDLHQRDPLERFINLLLGEIAERAVYVWLARGSKEVARVQKNPGGPDPGYDLIVKGSNGRPLTVSVKSSVSVYKSEINDILDTFKLAVTQAEARKADIHIQVYYWLEPGAQTRTTVPSISKAIIAAWAFKGDLANVSYASYTPSERRPAPEIKLRNLRPMKDLLRHLK